MTERINQLREYILDKRHFQFRQNPDDTGLKELNKQWAAEKLSPIKRAATGFVSVLKAEKPVILPGERIVFTRTITDLPDIFTEKEWIAIQKTKYLHERGVVCNISPDYEYTLAKGFTFRLGEIDERLEDPALTEDNITFLEAAKDCITALQDLIARYEELAISNGDAGTAKALHSIRTNGAGSFREALQLLRILHFAIWAAGNYHNTLGRFDQYMYTYYKQDIESGRITKEEAFELTEEFFLACNKDSDLYPGMQQGDNGQSMVLGGRSITGEYLFNELSELCLQASYELRLIDPKINIRVDKETPEYIYEMGSKLTKIGLGFPQYSNDDVVIPGLMKKGYTKEDAHDYVVAACWEFIIPKCAMDIPNIDAVSLIDCVSESIFHLNTCHKYDDFYKYVEEKICRRVKEITLKHRNLYIAPSPMISLLMDGTITKAQDISLGAKYNNYGIHGTGIATAADSLAAIKKYYFEEKSIDYHTLINALNNDFVNHTELQSMLRNEAPKMGQDDDYVDMLATELLDSFDKALANEVNERGGIYRAGTGTAMYYISHSKHLKATPDGRNKGEMIPANFSPTLFLRQKGPVSIIKSFTKQHLANVINGGPLTLEFDQSVFSNDESTGKLGMLVETFVHLGGHQLQLNTVNREKLLDAKKRPEQYRNLIVRVWGWSGYFVELDECYQDHVINRIEFGI
jgi:formate C-acetyltransferase